MFKDDFRKLSTEEQDKILNLLEQALLWRAGGGILNRNFYRSNTHLKIEEIGAFLKQKAIDTGVYT